MTITFSRWHGSPLPDFPKRAATPPSRPSEGVLEPELPSWLRRCTQCEQVKPVEDFRRSRNGTHNSRCVRCMFGGNV